MSLDRQSKDGIMSWRQGWHHFRGVTIRLFSIVSLGASRRTNALIMMLLFTLTACGEKRSVQCNKIGDVLNSTSSQLLSASSTSQGFSQGEILANQAADDLAALDLSDKTLSNLRLHLVSAYRESAAASAAMNSIAGPDGTVTLDANSSAQHSQMMEMFQQSGQRFSSIMNATQTYCNGGSVPEEFKQPPTQT